RPVTYHHNASTAASGRRARTRMNTCQKFMMIKGFSCPMLSRQAISNTIATSYGRQRTLDQSAVHGILCSGPAPIALHSWGVISGEPLFGVLHEGIFAHDEEPECSERLAPWHGCCDGFGGFGRLFDI